MKCSVSAEAFFAAARGGFSSVRMGYFLLKPPIVVVVVVVEFIKSSSVHVVQPFCAAFCSKNRPQFDVGRYITVFFHCRETVMILLPRCLESINNIFTCGCPTRKNNAFILSLHCTVKKNTLYTK
jgi:hypothetical protein